MQKKKDINFISAVQKHSHYRKQQNAKREGSMQKTTPSKQKSGDSLCMKSYYYYYYYYMYMTAMSTSSHVH